MRVSWGQVGLGEGEEDSNESHQAVPPSLQLFGSFRDNPRFKGGCEDQ